LLGDGADVVSDVGCSHQCRPRPRPPPSEMERSLGVRKGSSPGGRGQGALQAVGERGECDLRNRRIPGGDVYCDGFLGPLGADRLDDVGESIQEVGV